MVAPTAFFAPWWWVKAFVKRREEQAPPLRWDYVVFAPWQNSKLLVWRREQAPALRWGYVIFSPWCWCKLFVWREDNILPYGISNSVLCILHSALTGGEIPPLRRNNIIFSPWSWVKAFVKRREEQAPPLRRYPFQNMYLKFLKGMRGL